MDEEIGGNHAGAACRRIFARQWKNPIVAITR
jgi:hypothetical protein